MDQVTIRKSVLNVLFAHTQIAYPQEACGFLAGTGNYIHHLYLIENILQSHVAYEMDAQQQIEAMLHVEEIGIKLLATYHSHPTGPSFPSPTDVAQSYYPELLHLIISLKNRTEPDVKAFLIDENKIKEIKLIVG